VQEERNDVAEAVPAHVVAEPPNDGSEEFFDRPRRSVKPPRRFINEC